MRYNGFNLLAGDARRAAWGSNRGVAGERLAPGVHGVSNALLDTPWPKVIALEASGSRAGARPATTTSRRCSRCSPTARRAPDDELPATGVALECERLLSRAVHRRAPATARAARRSLTIGRDGRVRFVERRFDAAGAPAGESQFEFAAEDVSAARAAMTRCAMPASSNGSPAASKPWRA